MTLTLEQKAQRRAARQAWTARERARVAAQAPPPKPRAPTPPITVTIHTGPRSHWCEDGHHDWCGRVFTCRCACHTEGAG